ncbi:MAG: neuromedin U [Rhodospirillales bacterium]|nr:MAG: neuromedin U [Rhodospirillales bacterium]
MAAKSQNPIADLISLPIQPNFNFGLGPHDRTQSLVNVQPVIPIGLGDDFNLVTRVIMPLINQPDLRQSSGATFGLGDFNPTFFLVPKMPGNLMVGFGPTFLLPTATDRVLGNGKWGIGPSAVVVWSPAPWVLGALVNNIWSFAGDSQRKNVDRMTFQPFVNYNLPGGWYLSTGPIITADWTARSGDRWTVPVGGGVGKIWRIGHQPVNTSVQAYYNVVKPQTVNGPDWQLRLQWTFLFPK